MPKFRKNVFDELDNVKNLVRDIAPDFDSGNLSLMLGRLGVQHYKKAGMLLGREKKIYDVLVENGYNPYTVYKWSLLERIPEDVRHQLRNGVIGQKRAMKLSCKRRRENSTTLQINIRQQGLVLVRGL